MPVMVIIHFLKIIIYLKRGLQPDSIIDYLVFAKKYIAECEERYGIDAVEAILDACHALMNYGVDRYKHPTHIIHYKKKKFANKNVKIICNLKSMNYGAPFLKASKVQN